MRRPLVVTDDLELLDEILSLATIAGVDVLTAPDLGSGRLHWTTAPLVLVDVALVPQLSGAALPRRAGVAFVCRGSPPPVLAKHPWIGSGENLLPLPAASQVLLDRFAHYAVPPAERGRLVGVIAGAGGAGASVLAAGLAVTAVRLCPPSSA